MLLPCPVLLEKGQGSPLKLSAPTLLSRGGLSLARLPSGRHTALSHPSSSCLSWSLETSQLPFLQTLCCSGSAADLALSPGAQPTSSPDDYTGYGIYGL